MQLKNITLALVVLVIVILLTSCELAPQVNVSTDTATTLPSATPVSLPLPTEISSRIPQNGNVIQNCLEVLPVAPVGFTMKGIVPLEDYQTQETNFLNLKTGDTTKIPAVKEHISNFAISPDRTKLAYKVYSDSQEIRLTLIDIMNQQNRVILDRKNDFALYYWVNDQQILLGIDGSFVIFNPTTQEKISYTINDFPSYDTYNPHNDWVGIDPQVEEAIYKNKNGNTVLLDLDSKQIIAQIQDSYERSPVAEWMSDGNKAAIVGTTIVGKNPLDVGDNIFSVNRDGHMTQLTNLAEHYGAGFHIRSLNWSPDGRYIAYWMRYHGMNSNEWVLGVLDTSTKGVTNYCISTNPYATISTMTLPPGFSAPIWSPNGNQIIVEHRTDDSRYVILLDITQNNAFQVAQNAYPAGWMISP